MRAFMLTGPALAQNREVATLSFGYEGKARLTDLESENGVASVEMVETGARLNFPLYIGDRARVISGFGFKHTRFDFCNVGIERQDVYTVSIPFRTFFDISPKWSFMGSLFPSLYSDFEGVKYDDFKAAAVALGFLRVASGLQNSAWRGVFEGIWPGRLLSSCRIYVDTIG